MSELVLQQFLKGSIFHQVQKSPSGYEVSFSKQFLEQPGNVCKTRKYILLLDLALKPIGTFELPSDIIFRYCHPQKDIVIVGKVDKLKDEKTAALQIIKDGTLIVEKRLDGYCDLYEDFQFTSPNPWSPDCSKFVFVAERCAKEGEYKETFGEKFEGKGDPVVGIYDFNIAEIEFIEEGLDGFYPMSPSFLNSDTLVLQIYPKTEVKLGMVYCLNRPTQVGLLSNKELTILSNPELSARSPRVIDGKVLYLQGPIYASHYSAAQIIVYDLQAQVMTVLAEDHFEEALKPHFGARQLFTNPSERFSLPIKIIQTNQANHEKLDHHGELLSICEDICFFKKSTIKSFPSLHAILKDKSAACIFSQEALPQMQQIEEEFICKSPTFEILHYKKCPNKKLIMVPHGGPNCSTSNVFTIELNFFLASGYDVALINYTGSAGYGQASIDKLVIGQHDLEDNLQAALHFKPKYKKLFAYGGSHGGAIIAAMLGKYPDLFDAAAVVNPTIDHLSLAVISDIPDWCFGQFRQSFQLNNMYDDRFKMTETLSQVSPGRYAKGIRSPVLLMLGAKDRRVPCSQGLFWRKLCKGGDFIVRFYDDSDHSLDSEKSFLDVPAQVISFFEQKSNMSFNK